MNEIKKYPRTPHLEGSRLQEGDEDLSQIKFSEIKGKHLVIEEKIDGANSGISFINGELMIQSRGRFLKGGYKDKYYELLKIWAYKHYEILYEVLGNKYIMYGEWMYPKHRIYYDNLPSYFMEFDIYDKENDIFLDTKTRKDFVKRFLNGNLKINSCAVLKEGNFDNINDILSLIGKSNYITDNFKNNLLKTLISLDYTQEEINDILTQSNDSTFMEGIYIKVEDNGQVVNRLKFVRNNFTQIKIDTNTKWLNRTIIPNKLALDGDFDYKY